MALLDESELRSPIFLEPLTSYSQRHARADGPPLLNGDALGASGGAALHQGDIRLRNDVAIDRARQLVVSGSGFGVCSGSVVSLSNCDPEGRQDDGNAQDMIPFPRGRMHPPELSPFDGGFLLKVPCPGIPREDIRVELVGNRTVCVQQLAHSTARRARGESSMEQVVAEKSTVLPKFVDESEVSCCYTDGLLCVKLSVQELRSYGRRQRSATLARLEKEAVAAAVQVEKAEEELRKRKRAAAEALSSLTAAQQAANSARKRLVVM